MSNVHRIYLYLILNVVYLHTKQNYILWTYALNYFKNLNENNIIKLSKIEYYLRR